MTEPSSIVTAVDALPADSITVKILNALDFVVPGEWRNVVGFDRTAQDVLGALGGPQGQEPVGQFRNRYRTAGGEYRWLHFNEGQLNNPTGAFSFTRGYTQGPNAVQSAPNSTLATSAPTPSTAL